MWRYVGDKQFLHHSSLSRSFEISHYWFIHWEICNVHRNWYSLTYNGPLWKWSGKFCVCRCFHIRCMSLSRLLPSWIICSAAEAREMTMSGLCSSLITECNVIIKHLLSRPIPAIIAIWYSGGLTQYMPEVIFISQNYRTIFLCVRIFLCYREIHYSQRMYWSSWSMVLS